MSWRPGLDDGGSWGGGGGWSGAGGAGRPERTGAAGQIKGDAESKTDLREIETWEGQGAAGGTGADAVGQSGGAGVDVGCLWRGVCETDGERRRRREGCHVYTMKFGVLLYQAFLTVVVRAGWKVRLAQIRSRRPGWQDAAEFGG